MSLYIQPLLDTHDELIGDLFAGGGGASSGIEEALGRPVDFAINHDAAAIDLHKANHPQTLHLQSDVFEVDPRAVCGDRQLAFLWASPDCFVAGTLVLTRDGYVPIEQIAVGDEVFTHQKRWRRVTETMSSAKWVLKVSGHGHPGLYVSREHPFWIRHQNNQWNNTRRAYDRKLTPPEWLNPEQWRKGDAPMSAAGGNRSYWASPAEFPDAQVPEVGGRGMAISESLLWLAGRYLGDGWTRLTETRAELVLICGKHEANELESKLQAMWPRAGDRAERNELAWYRRDVETAVQLSTNHRGLVEWIRTHFGHGAAEKTVPGWAFGMARELRSALLAGYCSADGHDAGTWESVQTVSRYLAFGIRTLATTLGYVVTVHMARPQKDVIEGRRVNVRQAWLVKWRHVSQRETTLLEDGFRWSPVKSLDSQGYATTYNLSVEEDESYVVEGIVVHNCTHHSKARGGKPFRDSSRKRRALAWVVTRWAGTVRPRVIMLENVEEFAQWGPLVGPKDALRACKKRRGESFKKWVRSLVRLGYTVEWRELRACAYGAATIRKRLYLIARCDGQPIIWPEATHGLGLKPFDVTANHIDWSIPMCSIFATKEEAKEWATEYGVATPIRPLADATMRRIARGVMRYVVNSAKPFLVKLAHGEEANGKKRWGRFDRSTEEPIGTLTANAIEDAIVSPLVAGVGGRAGQSPERPGDAPLGTITGKADAVIVAPLIGHITHSGDRNTPAADEPLSTITCAHRGEHTLIAPNLVHIGNGEREGQQPRATPIDDPLNTIVGSPKHAVVATFLGQHNGGFAEGNSADGHEASDPLSTVSAKGPHQSVVAAFLDQANNGFNNRTGRPVDEPISTILTESRGHHGLMAAHMVQSNFGEKPFTGVDEPLRTVVAEGNHHAVVGSFIAKYYGTGEGQPADDPLGTITTVDRFGYVTVNLEKKTKVQVPGGTWELLEPGGYYIADICMRMLAPKELYACQGFRKGYIIDRGASGRLLTKTEQVRMVGNSVSPPVARALVAANCADLIARPKLMQVAS